MIDNVKEISPQRKTSFSNHKVVRIVKRIAQTVVAIAPFVWIFSKMQPSLFMETLGRTAWWTLPVVVLAGVLCIFLHGVRWWVLVRHSVAELPFSRMLKYHFVSTYYALVLPTSAAQDVVRAFMTARDIGHMKSWSASWVGKIMGLLALACIALYGLFALRSHLDQKMIAGIVIVCLIVAGTITFSFSKRSTRPFRLLLGKLLPAKAFRAVENVRNAIYEFRAKRGDLLYVFLLSLAIQMLTVISPVFIVRGITGKYFIGALFAFVPAIEFVTMAIPFTPNGIGVREGLYALMFTSLGLSKAQLGVFVVFSFLSVLVKIVGVVPILFDFLKRKPAQVPDNGSL